MTNQQLMTVDEARFMPALSLDQAIGRRDALVRFVQELMVRDTDYGVIPGTPKPTLLKPGAERLCSFFGLTPDFEVVKEVEDWTGEEPLFYYRYKCRLLRDGRVVGDGEGSCNSREGKYRWRESKRVCPECGQPAIIKGREEYGGGWLCFQKKGGCGAKFSAGDSAIEGQQLGRVPNPDIFDQVNTIQKMAQKRAFISATLIAVNASEFFSQDLDDMQPIGQQAPPPPAVDTELIASLRAELATARDRLRTIGGEPRPLTKKQVEALDVHMLTQELSATNMALWELTVDRMADKSRTTDNGDLFPDEDMAGLDAAVDAAVAPYRK